MDVDDYIKKANTRLQQLLDKTAPFKLYRWLALGGLVLLYATRVYYLNGFYIVTYGLGIYNLNLLLGANLQHPADGSAMLSCCKRVYAALVAEATMKDSGAPISWARSLYAMCMHSHAQVLRVPQIQAQDKLCPTFTDEYAISTSSGLLQSSSSGSWVQQSDSTGVIHLQRRSPG